MTETPNLQGQLQQGVEALETVKRRVEEGLRAVFAKARARLSLSGTELSFFDVAVAEIIGAGKDGRRIAGPYVLSTGNLAERDQALPAAERVAALLTEEGIKTRLHPTSERGYSGMTYNIMLSHEW